MRRLAALERKVERMDRGVLNCEELVVGRGTGRALILFRVGPGADTALPYVGVDATAYDPTAGNHVVELEVNQDGRNVATDWLTSSELTLSGALTGTTFAVQDANGDPVALEQKSTILVLRGRVLKPGTDFTLDTGGVTVTMTRAPQAGSEPAPDFFVLLARRKQ